MTAIWKGKVIADSDQTIVIEGNHYFPPWTVNRDFLEHSDFTTICHWKGEAHYYNIIVERRKKRKCGLVLSRTYGKGNKHQELPGLLEGCQG